MTEGLNAGSPQDLVIGIGNSLRGDDGVGWQLARRARRLRPAPKVLLVQQLTPELAEALATARRVLFVDAWLAPAGATASETTPPRLEPLQAWRSPNDCPGREGGEAGAFSHRLDPQQLLAITVLLHGEAPPAWQLLLPAYALGHGEQLSPALRHQWPAAQTLLDDWCRQARTQNQASLGRCMN